MPHRYVRRRLMGRLGVRLALVLSATLLPLGLILMLQVTAVEREARGRSEAALSGETLISGSALLRQIEEARGAAAALAAAMPALLQDPERCSAAMRAVMQDFGDRFSFVGFLPRDGHLSCTSANVNRVIEMTPVRRAILEAAQPTVTVNQAAEFSGEPVLIMSAPVRDAAGLPVGAVTVSVPHRKLAEIETAPGKPGPVALFTYDAAGNVLSASSASLDHVRPFLPANVSLSALNTARPMAFRGVSEGGDEQIFSITPVIENKLYLMGAWAVANTDVSNRYGGLPAWLFAALMWAATLGSALFGAERLVTRHVRELRRTMTAFALGNRRVPPPDLTDAADELKAVGAAYERMTESIQRDEAELENMLHHKDVLLREVHHRVKNNLQLIASIMNMQMRKAISGEARVLLKGLQDRVMSLATIHRELYQTSGLTDIRADELLTDITRQVLKLGSSRDRRFAVDMDFDPVVLSPDKAVPVALLMTEALTNAMKYAGSAEGTPARLSVSLKAVGDGARAELTVMNTVPPDGRSVAEAEEMATSSGLGTQLLNAFAQQVGGQLSKTRERGEYRLGVSFVVDAADAEEPVPRQVPEEDR